MPTFTPTRNTLLITQVRELPLYESEMMIPEEHRERTEPLQYGVVKAVGTGVPDDITVGATVFFFKYTGIPYGDTRYIHKDCICFIGEED